MGSDEKVQQKGFHKNMLIFHIGLPKTATTTLQRGVFQQLDQNSIEYLGVRQPREQQQDLLYVELMRCISSPDASPEIKLSVKKLLIKKQNEVAKPIVLSEEMISVDSGGLTWQEKYKNLADILCDLNYRIIITVREPVSALYSLYVELYSTVSISHDSLIDFFQNCNTAKIYRYGALYELLAKCFGPEKLVFLPFEGISQPHEYVTQLKKAIGLSDNIDIKLRHENQKKSNGQGTYVQATEKQTSGKIEFVRVKVAEKFRHKSLPKFLGLILKSINRHIIKFDGLKNRKLLPYPPHQDVKLLSSELQGENSVFNQKTGINYKGLHESAIGKLK
jgi:hypothetical protein